MTFYDQYVDLLTTFSAKHEDEIKSCLTYSKQRNEKAKAIDFFPEYGNKDAINDPQEKPIFKQFVSLFVDTFFTPYEDEIIADINGHHPEVNGKTLRQINAVKDLWDRPYLSTNYILDEVSFNLILDLISQTIFKGEDNTLKDSDYNMGFSVIRKHMLDVLTFQDAFPCSYCNAHAKAVYDFNRKMFVLPDYVLKQNPEPCPCINKSKRNASNYSFTLNTPSKKLVFLNDIRSVFEAEREDKYSVSINSELGRKRECEAYVEHNMAYFCTDNTSPTIYQNKTKNEIIIDSDHVKLKWDSNKSEIKKADEYHDRGYICTDLWAVCMADHDDFMSRCAEKDIDPASLNIVIVDISSEEIKVKYNFSNHLIQIKY